MVSEVDMSIHKKTNRKFVPSQYLALEFDLTKTQRALFTGASYLGIAAVARIAFARAAQRWGCLVSASCVATTG
jgi:hypothetical protein